MTRRCASAFLAVFAAIAPLAARAQPAPKSAASMDAATPKLGLRAMASNSLSISLTDIVISAVTLEARSSSGQTGRRTYEPIKFMMSLPAGGGPQGYSFGLTQTGLASGDGTTQQFTYQKIESVVLALSLSGASCSARVPARFDEGGKQVVAQLGDMAGFFDAQRKPVATKCSAG